MNHISPIYTRSTTDGVWQRPDHGAFGYSDGDEVENHIASLITAAKDCSVLSPELRSHIVDWPTRYHLSQQRANILRPLRSSLSGAVLEIGSGCGAITRYLGETASSVTALEGSRRRAHITRLRTRDQHNVEVICDEFSAFQTEQRFDAVTLIGVLEYANMFVGTNHAALHMLSKAKERLNDSGCLIIAIENQLGLKYWAGAPEDHLGQAMLGLEDKYQAGGVRTYGKQVLSDLLKKAGFESVKFLYPFPDYKLPSCVLTEQAFNDPAFDPTPFLVMTAGKDHQLPADPAFCLERVWPVIQANRLSADLSNSFLVVARRQDKSDPVAQQDSEQSLAWHYSTQRLPQYCKETAFRQDPGDVGVSIVRTPLSTGAVSAAISSGISHRLEDDTPYAALPLLSSVLIDIVTRPRWSDQQLADFVLLYAEQLAQIGQIELVHEQRVRWEQPVPGWLFDCIPQNIRLHPDGTCSAFDLEWRIDKELSFVQIVFRSLWHTLDGLSLIGVHASESRLSILDIITRALHLLGKDLSITEAMSLVRSELHLQQLLTGETSDFEQVWQWFKTGNHRHQNVHQRLSEYQSHAANQTHLIEEQKNTLAQWQQHCHNLTQEIGNRDLALSDLQRTIQSIHEKAVTDSLRSSLALRRLTKQSTKENLISRSAKNLVKLNRDFQHVMRKSTTASSRWNTALPIKRLAVVKAWQHAKPAVVALTRVDHDEQPKQLMTQSCHWCFPFEWRFSSAQASMSQSIPVIASQLEIDAQIFIHTDAPAPEQVTWLEALPGHSYLAFPRLVNGAGIIPEDTWPLPDAELLRLAYVALLCDSELSMVYVGASEILQSSQHASSGHPLMVIARDSTYKELSATISFWNRSLSADQLEEELTRARQAMDDRQQRILVI